LTLGGFGLIISGPATADAWRSHAFLSYMVKHQLSKGRRLIRRGEKELKRRNTY